MCIRPICNSFNLGLNADIIYEKSFLDRQQSIDCGKDILLILKRQMISDETLDHFTQEMLQNYRKRNRKGM